MRLPNSDLSSYLIIVLLLETEPALCRGDSVHLVGLSKNRAISRKSIVTNSSLTLNIGPSDTPRYRAINLEVIELDNGKQLNLNCLTSRYVKCLI